MIDYRGGSWRDRVDEGVGLLDYTGGRWCDRV